MSVLQIRWLEEDPEWVRLIFPKNTTFHTWLKKIGNTAVWNEKTRRWEVHLESIIPVIRFSKKLFDRVDYSGLPEALQIAIVSGLQSEDTAGFRPRENRYKKKVFETSRKVQDSPFSALFLTESAPSFLVKNVYKILSLKYHPDQGGDVEDFKKLNDAYKKIKQLREDL